MPQDDEERHEHKNTVTHDLRPPIFARLLEQSGESTRQTENCAVRVGSRTHKSQRRDGGFADRWATDCLASPYSFKEREKESGRN